ncbi:hypothetical protein [Pedobacter aquatilis]|uniref:hypothetical protein n=1 Tax=Pedobacter aquatilis TaxID=351343 RepID=UPI0029300DE7|nr:hypothetical protein [Pedobacter aquatilis]
MKNKFIIVIALITISKASLFAQHQKEVIHFNLIFAPDLSNRLNEKMYPKPINDTTIVRGILKEIWSPNLMRYKRSEGQMDHYRVDFINKGLINLYNINTNLLNLDFQRFDRQSDRINYIMARNNVTKTLNKDINIFMNEYRKIISKASISNNGADVWSYFNSGIDDRIILPSKSNGKVIQRFRNIMILMTDGYIEAGIYHKGYDLSAAKINAFRNAFLKSKESDMAVFLSENKNFKIKPAQNAHLKNLELIVLEMYDRSLSKSGAARSQPTDMEIMKVIWSDWLRNSGVKRFQLKSCANSQMEVVQSVLNFLKE